MLKDIRPFSIDLSLKYPCFSLKSTSLINCVEFFSSQKRNYPYCPQTIFNHAKVSTILQGMCRDHAARNKKDVRDTFQLANYRIYFASSYSFPYKRGTDNLLFSIINTCQLLTLTKKSSQNIHSITSSKRNIDRHTSAHICVYSYNILCPQILVLSAFLLMIHLLLGHKNTLLQYNA